MLKKILVGAVLTALPISTSVNSGFFVTPYCESGHVSTQDSQEDFTKIMIDNLALYRIKEAIEFFETDLDSTSAFSLAKTVKEVSEKEDIDSLLLVALMNRETNFRSIKGDSGEIGICQIMPYWAPEFGYEPEDLWDIETNITVAAKILNKHLERYDGRLFAAVRAYNGQHSRGTQYARDVTRMARTLEKL